MAAFVFSSPLRFPLELGLPVHHPKTLNLATSLQFPLRRLRPLSAASASGPVFDMSPAGADDDDDDEEPVFFSSYNPEDKEVEDAGRRRSWVEHGWAPWEEVLSPEADFARKSLDEGEQVPLQSPEAIEAFRRLTPSYRARKMKEETSSQEEYLAKLFAYRGEIPDPIKTSWDGPLTVRLVPPRDWPPPGWEVDLEELEFIRGAHRMQAERVDIEAWEKGEARVGKEGEVGLDRYKVFLKQYKEWVEANRDRLEEESYKFDLDYYPGRRKRGKDYHKDMLELPFFYPGQICRGKVTTLHLHQGAFVDIGGVHDGWVPIRGNDWYWVRHHIKVGMHVYVEILAKRDPYRFRFPIEMRFVDPNIDHLIFNRFDYPPIFHHRGDDNPEEMWRECKRPPIPRKRPAKRDEELPLVSDHPYVDTLWHLHNAEQMILDHEEENPEKYKDKPYETIVDFSSFDEENRIEYSQDYFKKTLLRKATLKTDIRELDLAAARAERQLINKLKEEAAQRGEEYKVPKLRRNVEMDEYDLMHLRRSTEEREALIRDISSRKTLGLPVDEPDRFDIDEKKFLGKNYYDPSKNLCRYDYWGEPKNSEKIRLDKETEDRNSYYARGGKKWFEMSYEDFVEEKTRWEEEQAAKSKKAEESEKARDGYDDDIDFDFSVFNELDPDSEGGLAVIRPKVGSGMAHEEMVE